MTERPKRPKCQCEVQAQWLRFASGCPYGNSDDGCCGHSENVTPECTLWACPLTMERLDADLTAVETMFMNAGAECTRLREKWVASEQEVLTLSAEVEGAIHWAALWKSKAKEYRTLANSHAERLVTAMENLLALDAERDALRAQRQEWQRVALVIAKRS